MRKDMRAEWALADYLNAQIDRIVAGDMGLRRGHDQDLIHDTRVAIRRRSSGTAKGGTIKYYKHVQTVLGDHQDTVVATEALRRMATTAGTTVGENGFTHGML
jgi:CHAD domain-containing protein